jgi:hypothetical protein
MGGKSGGPKPPAAVDPAADMAAMMSMMSAMSAMPSFAPPSVPIIPETPEVKRTREVDWKKRTDELGAKAKADFENDQAGKKGRQSTVHTSPLLDEEAEDQNDSILAGG